MDSDFESSTVSRVTTCNDYMTTEYFNKLLEEKNYNKIIRDILIKRITADELSGYDYSFIILAYSHLEQDDNADFYYNLALKNKKFSEENIIFLIQEFNEMENYNCAITVGLEAIELNLFSKENKLNFFEYADEVGAYNAIITMAKKLLQDSDINKKAKLDIHCKTMHALNCKEQYQSAIEYFNKILKDGETSEDIFSQAIFSK